MGIPSYFNFILRNHSKIIRNKNQIKSDFLFVDANSLIYDTINEFKDQVPDDNKIIYQKVYENIKNLINKIRPINKSYICFDGIPPCAKMNQQRQRRFKSSLTNKILNNSCDKKIWNRNQITPGTLFMNGLDNFLKIKFSKESKISFSPSCEENEGEHKISNIITSNNSFKQHNLVIYGLDADLFMLGLLLVQKGYNIFLYKETIHFSYINSINEKESYYFDIVSFSYELSVKLGVERNQAICDYCLMAFLCGNDFLPHLHSINIRNNGISYIIDSYLKMNGHKYPLINVKNGKIKWDNFSHFITILSKGEEENILLNLRWKLKQKKKKQPLNMADKLDLLPCFDTEKEDYLNDNFFNYRDYVFDNIPIKNICCNYIEMIEWTWYYYYNNKIINNSKYYFYGKAPLLKDLLSFIPLFDNDTFLTETKEDKINEIALLLYVLPYEEHEQIIPSEIYSKIKKNIYLEIPLLKETNCNVDYLLCKYFWESHLELVHIDIFNLNKLVINEMNK
tara:strand:+ start:6544 stop:8070 length:1527 start_codon:yes stop_codon:yes gene_type:complete